MLDTVIADAVYVLSSRELYNVARVKVWEFLAPLVRLPHFRIHNRLSVLRALEIYASSNLDFGDALIIASMEQQEAQVLYSYDTDFDCIGGIIRREP